MVTATTTGRKFVVGERFDFGDGEQAVLGCIVDGEGETGYRVGFSNHEPDFGPVVTWGHGNEVDYWVTCNPAGKPEQCTCPDFKFQRKRRGEMCKHGFLTWKLIRRGFFKMPA